MSQRLCKHQKARYPWLVASNRGLILGFAYGDIFRSWEAYCYSAEVTIYLNQSICGKGIGTLLYNQLFSELKKQNIKTAVGIIAQPNPISNIFHEKLGFKKVGVLSSIGYKHAHFIDTWYFQKKL